MHWLYIFVLYFFTIQISSLLGSVLTVGNPFANLNVFYKTPLCVVIISFFVALELQI